jgi:hypothetical protein
MATYTNLSILQGWFEIDSLQTIARGREQVPVILGLIFTTDEEGAEQIFSEQHPVIISDRPAKAVLDIMRKLNDKYPSIRGVNLVHLPDELSELPQIMVRNGRPFVIAQGKLITYEGHSYVDVKHISFLGLPWGAMDAFQELEGETRQQ